MKVDNKFLLEKLISKDSIKNRVSELSEEISLYFPIKDDFVAICVLNGSLFFYVDLIKGIKQDTILDTIKVKSYNKNKRKNIKVLNDSNIDLKGKNVLIVEDIIDTGQTINFLYDYILKKSPKDIKIVSFLFKPDVYKLNINIDWVGFSIDNNFVVGYGLDYDEKFRGLDSIYKLVREK